jgi:acyl-CoA hydrolase
MASTMASLSSILPRARALLLAREQMGLFGLFKRESFYSYSAEPFHPIANKVPLRIGAEEAVSVIKSGDRVFVHGCAAMPAVLVNAMTTHGKKSKLSNVEVVHIHIEGPAPHTAPEFEGIFRDNSLFIGANCRKAVNEGRADSTPIFLGEIPLLFHRGILPVDVALIQVTEPDEHGFCSLGPSVDCTRAALMHSKYIIGQTNINHPRTFGDGLIHMSHIDALVEGNLPMPERKKSTPTDVEEKIGNNIAENLVAEGATLQMGIGSIPDAVLSKLKGHRDLGIHSEMFSDGIIPLVECGAITNARKVLHPGKIVGGFAYGTKKLYDFMNNNPFIVMCDIGYVNDVSIICQNPKVTAINSCIEIDLTGQAVSDSIGTRQFSGVGGQVDFIRGAARSRDGLGKPILALPSVTNKGESKICDFIKPGAGVVSTRAHVHYVVTEHGVAYLFGKTLRQRAHALIQIAHPMHREKLEKAAFERLKCMPAP